ncbi:MAG: 4-hydroxy-tetrahydrodipicolinate synthase [Pseudomonadales bacterium]|jgi:4-hydroxy-tetrahydrodipicolinate synthase|nr:4-hydroxy-tetrahydrodipicolinate synthase [Pseudomonadales bacterium]
MITGSIVALVTPMTPDGALDSPALSRLVEWHITEGTNAIVAVGTTGESATLSVEEHVAVIRQVVQVAAGRIPVIAGTGANATSEAIEWTEAARQAGADACLLVTPYYNKPSQRGLYEHHKAIAEAVDIPQILYNVPGRTACDMLPDTIAKLAEIPNITGVKEATGSLERGRQVLQLVPEGFAVYSGDDASALELILLGAKGNISVTANVIPRVMSEICRLGLAGEADAARALNARIAALHKDLFLESNPVPVKWALKEMGLIQSGIRLPLVELDPIYHEPLRQTLRACAES